MIHQYNGDLYYKPEYLKAVKVEDAIVPRFEISAYIALLHAVGGKCFVCWVRRDCRLLGRDALGKCTVEVGGCSIAPSLPKNWNWSLSALFAMAPQWYSAIRLQLLAPTTELSGRRPEGLSGVFQPGAQAGDTQHTSTHESSLHCVLGVHDSTYQTTGSSLLHSVAALIFELNSTWKRPRGEVVVENTAELGRT